MGNVENKGSWLERTTGLNIWALAFWAIFAVSVTYSGWETKEAIYSHPTSGRPATPTIINGGRPSGGRLLDFNDGRTYKIDDLRGNWTLIVFSAYSCPSATGGFTPSKRCDDEHKDHLNSLRRGLGYFHQKLSSHGVKVWVVRIDHMFDRMPGAETPSAPYDRYFLARMVKSGNIITREPDKSLGDFQKWIVNQWIIPSGKTGSVYATVSPYFALLDPEGHIRFLEPQTSNINIVNAVYKAMGKRDLVIDSWGAPALNATINSKDYAVLGKFDESDLYEPNIQRAINNGEYKSVFRRAQGEPILWGSVPCVVCGSVILDPAMYLLFGVKPSDTPESGLPDRKILSFRKSVDRRAKANTHGGS